MLIEKLNAKTIQNLDQLYENDAVIEINEHTSFVGISEIGRFWRTLIFGLEGDVFYRDVKIEFGQGGAVNLSLNLGVEGTGAAHVDMNQTWYLESGYWRMRLCKIQVPRPISGPADSFMNFLETFSASFEYWLSGQDVSEENWSKIEQAFAVDSGVMLIDGQKFAGFEFPNSIFPQAGSSPGLSIEISQPEMLIINDELCVVSFVDSRRINHQASYHDVRNTLAVVRQSSLGWKWRHLQQTSIDPE